MKYENRVVAYIDILGFKSLLEDTIGKDQKDNSEAIDSLIEAYREIREILNLDSGPEFRRRPKKNTKRVSIFSDCLVISFAIEQPSEVFYTLLQIKWLIMGLVKRKILCRGAVSVGKFIHNSKFLFGPALVEAYTLESKAAIYPRVILDQSIVDVGVQNRANDNNPEHEREFLSSLLGRDSDGLYYVDYFAGAQNELNEPIYDMPSYITALADIIRKGLMGSSHPSKADLRVKFSWMRERFNQMVEQFGHKDIIISLRHEGEIELADFYQSLKKISPNRDMSFWQSHRKRT